MKTAISIPDKVFRSADSLAKRLGVSRSQLYATAITEFLLRHQSRKVTERLDHIYEEEDSSLAQGFITAEMKSLPTEEWCWSEARYGGRSSPNRLPRNLDFVDP